MLRLSALGDVIVAMTAVSTLRASLPDAHLTWLVEDRHADLLAGFPDVDRVLVFERRRLARSLRSARGFFPGIAEGLAFLRALRRERFDLALDFQGNLKSAVFSLASRAPVRVGFAKGACREGNHLANTHHVEPDAGILHRIDKDLALLGPLGIRGTPAAPTLLDDEADRRFADEALDAAGCRTRPFAVLHPGTSAFGEFKRWPVSRFSRLGDRLVEEMGFHIVVTWGPGEEAMARGIVEGMREGEAASVAPPTSTLRRAVALLRRAHLFVGADTGVTHLAALLGVRTVALFGPKDPAVYAPRGENVRVVTHAIDCRPCGARSCRLGDPLCMTDLEEERVLGAVRRLLDALPMPPSA